MKYGFHPEAENEFLDAIEFCSLPLCTSIAIQNIGKIGSSE